MRTKKMYVLVRNDLAETYKLVQGSHALARYALEFHEAFLKWNNSTIVFLAVRNIKELNEYSLKLHYAEKDFSLFFEPDLGQVTALACYDDGLIFKDLRIA